MKNTEEQVATAVAAGERPAGKYLTFFMGKEEFGLQILKVKEIIRLPEITAVPNTPEYLRGIINLRGQVIPVVELRKKFGMEPKDDSAKTCIVVVQVSDGRNNMTVGIIIDEVREVRDLVASDIEPVPSFGVVLGDDYLLGIGKVDNRVIMLLDSDALLIGDLKAFITSEQSDGTRN